MVKLDSKRFEDILKFLIGLVLIILINNLANRAFFRIDLTEEKRYSISDATKELLQNLDDVVFVEVYLEGDLPAGFERFQKGIRETLEEFRLYADNKIQYKFIDPLLAVGEKARNEFMVRLNNKGIQPTNLYATEDGKRIEKLIFPGAIVYYGGQETGVMLLKGSQSGSSQERLNQSIEGIEYELASAIRNLASYNKKRIALIKGQGELDSIEIEGLKSSLREYYEVNDVILPEESLNNFDAMILAKPTKAFSEQAKYKMDQFIMNGGKSIFLLDAVNIVMDSIGGKGTVAYPYNLDLTDQLFSYGIRLNNTLIQDMNAALYPVVVGRMGDQPQIRPLPWPYFPLINNYTDHPIVRNLDASYLQFVSTLDTVKASGIKKTPLMYTSPYSRIIETPVNISLNEIRNGLEPDNFTAGPQAVGFLLEGSFTSLYSNRFLPANVDKLNFTEIGEPTKIVVVSDGDLVQNAVNRQTGRPFPLGFDPISENTFANKDFIINALAYLLEDDGIITARNKEVKIRPLDKVKIQDQKLFWQIANLGLPVVLVIIFGVVKYYIRKKKYTKF